MAATTKACRYKLSIMRQRIFRFLSTYIILVAVFAMQHPIFAAVYHSLMDGASFTDIMLATWHGLRLDLSMAGYLAAVPGLLIVTSVWTKGKALAIIRRTYFAIIAAVIAFSFVADLCLYDYWGFRLDVTPMFYFMTSPADAMASVSIWFVALGIIIAAAYGFGIYWLLEWPYRKAFNTIFAAPNRIAATIISLILTGALFIPIRGGFTTATMNLSVAYFSQNQRLNHTAINPLFSFMFSAMHQTDFASQYRFMDDREASSLMQSLTDKPVEATDSLPHLFTVKRPNVIIVILESFSSHLMPSLGGENIAPNLDRLGAEGILFTNFWGNSFRTDRGLVSIISGYPAQPSTSIMKFSEKVENLPSIPRAMRNAGYDLAYYYGGDANFTNMRAYLVSAGFDRIISDKDFPLADRTGKWGAQDHLVFNRLLSDLKADTTGKPLLRIIQTSSSHEPFEVPFNRFTDIRKNAFAYTDDCLGKFVDSLRKMPLWNNTVVIFVPDHQGAYPQHIDNPLDRHRIPLVMAGGAIAKPMTIDVCASQIDIAATLLYQLGIDHKEFIFSKNILNPKSPHFGYFTEPSLFGMVTDKNQLVFNLDANAVMIDEGSAKGTNLNPGKAFLQKLYDDLDKR